MEYTVESMDELTLVGVERRFDYKDSLEKIPRFWDEYGQMGGWDTVPGAWA